MYMKLDYFAQPRGFNTCTANRIYAYSAEASPNENVFAQPYQNDIVQRYFGGIVW